MYIYTHSNGVLLSTRVLSQKLDAFQCHVDVRASQSRPHQAVIGRARRIRHHRRRWRRSESVRKRHSGDARIDVTSGREERFVSARNEAGAAVELARAVEHGTANVSAIPPKHVQYIHVYR